MTDFLSGRRQEEEEEDDEEEELSTLLAKYNFHFIHSTMCVEFILCIYPIIGAADSRNPGAVRGSGLCSGSPSDHCQ